MGGNDAGLRIFFCVLFAFINESPGLKRLFFDKVSRNIF